MKVFSFVQLFHISERGGGAEVQANYLATELANHFDSVTNENPALLDSEILEANEAGLPRFLSVKQVEKRLKKMKKKQSSKRRYS